MFKKLRKILLICILFISIGFGSYTLLHGSKTEYRFKNDTYQSTKLPNTFNDFTIAYISDINLHQEKDLKRLKKIIKDLNTKNVDMVLFGGDLYDGQVFKQDEVIKILKKIKSSYGQFAVLGEKDQVDKTTCTNILTESGFEVLHNEYRKIYYNDQSISLFGLENSSDISTLLNDDNKNSFKLALVHQPDYFQQLKSSVQLQLSGHTLGGYIKLPLIGGLEDKDLGTLYRSGIHKSKQSTLIVSNGLSFEKDHDYRIFTYNEINMITLKK